MTTPRQPTPASQQRRFAILRAIARHPGSTPEQLLLRLAEAAVSGEVWSRSTLFADIKVLKSHGLLDQGRHRGGYFLVGEGLAPEEFQTALNGLRIQALDLAYPPSVAVLTTLERRAERGRDDDWEAELRIESVESRPVVRMNTSDIEDLIRHLQEPMQRGAAVELHKVRDPWSPHKAGARFAVYPLQFLYHDVAWYLLAEDAGTQRFVTLRVDRLHPAVVASDLPERGGRTQTQRQARARALLRRGWGMAMPTHGLEGELTSPLVRIELKFEAGAAAFMSENAARHDTQMKRTLPDGGLHFSVELPEDVPVLFQFRRWVLSWGSAVEVLSPSWFRAEVGDVIRALAARYDVPATDTDAALYQGV